MNIPFQNSSYNGTGVSSSEAESIARSLLTEGKLSDLTDVNIPEVIDNLKLLQYNNTSQKWEATNGINQESDIHSIFTTQDVGDGSKSLLSSELFFQKTANTSLLYIQDDKNGTVPLQFNITQTVGDSSNNTVLISVDNIQSTVMALKNNKVGIGVVDPEEELEVDGSIQIDSANVARLKFQQSGQNPHALAEIDGEQDGTNGGTLEFYTKVDGGSVTEKLRINNVGALGIGGANYGNAGQVIVSNGSGNAIEWVNPVNELGDLSDVNTSGLIAEGDVLTLHNAGQNPEYRIKPIPDQIQPALTNLTGGKIVASADLLGEKSLIDSNITTGVNTTSVAGNLTIDSTLTANGSSGTVGQVLTSNGSSPAYWADASGGGGGNQSVYQVFLIYDSIAINYHSSDWRRLGNFSLNSNKNYWVETQTGYIDFEKVSSVSDNSLLDSTEGAFKAPRNGIYEIKVVFMMRDDTASYMHTFISQLVKKRTDGTEAGITLEKHNLASSSGDLSYIKQSSFVLTGVVKLLTNELVYAEFLAEGGGSYALDYRQQENNRQALGTHMSIKSID